MRCDICPYHKELITVLVLLFSSTRGLPSSPVGMEFDFIMIAPAPPQASHWVFSFVCRHGVSSSGDFQCPPMVVVQKLVVISVLCVGGEVSMHPSTLLNEVLLYGRTWLNVL